MKVVPVTEGANFSRRMSEVVHVRSHFARSANVERDHGLPLDEYIPTARAREVLGRLIAGIEDPRSGRALTITGTYGTGKSSLALFLSALLGAPGVARDSAQSRLHDIDPDLAASARRAISALPKGAMICAAATAAREPVSVTLLRALQGAVRELPAAERRTAAARAVLEGNETQVLGLLKALAKERAVLLILDEFGKNIEEFVATGGREADLIVMQAIAEWSTERGHHPVIVLTLQHLALNEYDRDGLRGREWSKIQGRFQDIPYVDTPAESQALMATVHACDLRLGDWSAAREAELNAAGLRELLFVSPHETYPLHPTLVAALPALCARYGQNERTLFSFLAGPDAFAVPSLLSSTNIPRAAAPPSIELHHAYDYFVASASAMVGASPHASRWIEIESRLRDTMGLGDGEQKVLKTIGVLNLIAAGGALRASRELLRLAVADLAGSATVDSILDQLEQRGLVTYRDFADEYRVWSGTDYDLKSHVEAARNAASFNPIANMLNEVQPQEPVVAARHSQEFGVLRVFSRQFADGSESNFNVHGQDFDGLVLLSVSGEPEALLTNAAAMRTAQAKPVIIGVPEDDGPLVEAARDLAAFRAALRAAERSDADWVARRELQERGAAASLLLAQQVQAAFGIGVATVRWHRLDEGGRAILLTTAAERRKGVRTLSSMLSDVCDARYNSSPKLRNEMLSRRSLTSQGAKARRDLLEAMIEQSDQERCGLEGYGPERAMYHAVLERGGLHRKASATDTWTFGAPSRRGRDDFGFQPAWDCIHSAFKDSEHAGVSVRDVYARLMEPPIGLKEGPIPVLLTAALVASADTVAIYENGTFLTRLDTPTVERLIRNPELFSLKQYPITGQRGQIVGRLADTLGARSASKGARVAALVGVVSVLLGRARALPPFAQKTRKLPDEVKAARSVLFSATDPEDLIFKALPRALKFEDITKSRAGANASRIEEYADSVQQLIEQLQKIYPRMRDGLIREIADGLSVPARGRKLRPALRARFSTLQQMPLEASLQSFLFALLDEALDDEAWADYLCMVLLSRPPSAWSDEEVSAASSRASHLCQQLRHVESIYFARPEPSGRSSMAGTAVRLGLTRSDGVDVSRVVHVDDSSLMRVDSFVEQLLGRLPQALGENAAEMVLARLAEAVLSDRTRQLSDGPVGSGSTSTSEAG
jgi:hypothetical protein